jgi:hypothetical protein
MGPLPLLHSARSLDSRFDFFCLYPDKHEEVVQGIEEANSVLRLSCRLSASPIRMLP